MTFRDDSKNTMDFYSVMITGANRGIGLEFVRQLAQCNPPPKYIFATYRDKETIQELIKIKDASEGTSKVYLIKLDITDDNEILNAANIIDDVVKDEGLTLLINNSGVLQQGSFPNLTKKELEFPFSVNAVGSLLLTQAMHPFLKRSAARRSSSGMSFLKAGILNITSLTSSITNTGVEFVCDLAVTAYKISKAAMNMGMRICAAECKKDNILVVMMCPGWVKTDMGTKNAQLEPKDSIAAMLETLPKLDESHQGMFMDRHGNPYPF